MHNVLTPVLQYGFAGFSLLLLGLLYWMIRKLLEVLHQTAQIIADNKVTTELRARQAEEEIALLKRIHEQLLERPCFAGLEEFMEWRASNQREHR